MNVFIHQNNETIGPFDEDTLKELLQSGQILPLTFACLEGESAWRPVFEIISLTEKAAPPAGPPQQLHKPPPVMQGASPRVETKFVPPVTGARENASSAIDAKPLSALKIGCPKCGQHILVDASFAGLTGVCPTCGGPVSIPAFAPAPSSSPVPAKNDSIFGHLPGFVYRLSGLQPLHGFKISCLFADAFKGRSRSDVDAYLNCGSATTTPEPATLNPDWPRPWFYLRILLSGLLVLFAFSHGFARFQDSRLLPVLMITGAFLVPLTCAALFFEFNVPRNISFYLVVKLIVCGAIVSLPVTMYLSAHIRPDLFGTSFFGAMSVGILEEIAKALTAVLLLRGARQYKWILNGLLAGAAVAAGFAGIGSAGFISIALHDDLGRSDGKLAAFYAIFADMAVWAPLCHILWSASVAGALWRVKGEGPFHISLFFRKPFLRVFIFVIALQALWNSALLRTSIGKFSLVRIEQALWVISIIGSWYLVLLLVQEGLRQVRAATVSSLANQPEPERDTSEGIVE